MEPQVSLDAFKAVASRIQPEPSDVKMVPVTCDMADSTIQPYVDGLAQAIINSIDNSSESVDDVSKRLRDYINMLLICRILQTQNKRLPIPPTERTWIVPAFVNVVLEQIGRLDAPEYGLFLQPVLTSDQEAVQVWDASKISSEARWLRVRLQKAGIEYAQGLPKSREGSFEMMTLQVINDEVRGESLERPGVYALMAGFLGIRAVEAVFAPRCTYATMSQIRQLLSRVVDYESNAGIRDR